MAQVLGKEPSASGADISGERRLYEDFEPYCRWHRGNEKDVIKIELKGFEKQQLHVKLCGKRVIEISGEQPLEEPPKWQRFRKEIKLQTDWKANDISAHFSAGSGILSITIPKRQESGRQLMNSSLGFKVGLVTLLVLGVVFATWMPEKIWPRAAKL